MFDSYKTRITIPTTTRNMAGSPCLNGSEKKHWWLNNRKIVDKYVKDARNLIATQEQSEIASALNILDAALALSPRFEVALELKARSLLYLRRFRDVADMLQDYIPSLKMAEDESGSVSSDNSSQQLSRERVKLLPSDDSSSGRDRSFKCFSVSDLKKKVMAGLYKNCEKEGQWRLRVEEFQRELVRSFAQINGKSILVDNTFIDELRDVIGFGYPIQEASLAERVLHRNKQWYLVLGQACCRLGLMEDAMVLLQTGKRLSMAAFRRESISWSDDSFSFTDFPISNEISASTAPSTPPRLLTESDNITQLLSHIKLLLRRRGAAIAAIDAGLHSEAIRHFTKIVEGRRGAPQSFLAECYMHRAFAYKSCGRIAESIGDCNKTLAFNPSCIQALETRASLFETIRCLPDCLHDLEHLKLLYNSILRDRKLPGPAWKRHNVRYREIPGKLCALTSKIQELKQRVASGETGNVDYHSLMGLRRGCSRSELERAHLLLCLRHKPDKATNFVERCDFADDTDLDSVRDRAKMSALLLYRLLQKGYSNVTATIMEEAADTQRKHAAAAIQAAQAAIQVQQTTPNSKPEQIPSGSEISDSNKRSSNEHKLATSSGSTNPSVFQGVFCRDLAVVGNLLSQTGFNRPLPLKYEALSC